MLSPKSLYQQKLADKILLPDIHQEKAVIELDKLFWQLHTWSGKNKSKKSSNGWFSRFGRVESEDKIKGIYLWGGVGRGKTHLCDMFFNQVSTSKKIRLHYHRFMILVQESLMAMDGVVDPIDKVASNWVKKYKLLLLDEMHINDITNALLMKRLLHGLFERGTVLVTTSNTPPSGLYKDGLQRQEFIPAIKLMEDNTRVFCLHGNHDYRLQTLRGLQTFLTPITVSTESELNGSFREIAGYERDQTKTGVAIINEREIPIIKCAAGVIWFEFEELCNTPRSNEDYIEIANFFHTVIISNVPQMGESLEDAARRFVNMIDEFYDNSTNVILSSQVVPELLYVGNKLNFEFERAISRLLEMQSKKYFSKTRVAS